MKEDFLAAYDPKLRKDAGAYYTPVEVVRCQVRLLDDLLVNRLNRPLGFADPGVITLDPTAGTGTYLLGVIEHALGRIKKEQGPGAVPGQATELANNLYGFELMVGPYAVTELRVSHALRDRGAILPKEGTHVYLTDTLESPHAVPPQLPLILKPIAEQHARALKVKEANILPDLLKLLSKTYKRKPLLTPEDFLAYGYGILAQPAFTERFKKELESRELRVPITKKAALFEKVRAIGARLLWLHTYGQRFVPEGKQPGQVPSGKAKCTRAVPGDKDGYPEDFDYNEPAQTLRVGDGRFSPVSRAVYEFEVSGLKVVQSWLKYRMKKGAGKKSSPLDDIRPEH